MPAKLNRNNRFVTVRSMAALADDSTPPSTSLDDAQRFDAGGAEYIVVYWTGTTPGGNIALTAWVLDGIKDQFVEGDQVTGLVPNKLVRIRVHGATNATLMLSGTGAGSGTNIEVRAMASVGDA